MMIRSVLTLLAWQRSSAVEASVAVEGRSVTSTATTKQEASGPSKGLPYPPLSVIHGNLLTTAEEAFGGHQGSFDSSADWHSKTILRSDQPAPYLACTAADDTNGSRDHALEALAYLRQVLSSHPSRVRVVSSSDEHGVCFFASATPAEAETVRRASNNNDNRNNNNGNHLSTNGVPLLASWVPFPSSLKLAPGLLDHVGKSESGDTRDPMDQDKGVGGNTHDDAGKTNNYRQRRLSTTHGRSLNTVGSEAHGLTIELAPGVLTATNRRRRRGPDTKDTSSAAWHADTVDDLVERWQEELMAETLDVHQGNFWATDSRIQDLNDSGDDEGHRSNRGGQAMLLSREWTRAADVLHGLAGMKAGPTVGGVCSWEDIDVHETDDDLLTMTGIDHLLPNGRGAGGIKGEEADELQMACLMGLLSFLTSRPEVLRVSAARRVKLLNGAAFPNVQSATLTDTPLTDFGLDGSGEIIQIVDTGLDYTSCFFVDEDGVEVEHGHYFEEIGVTADALSSWYPSYSFSPKLAQIFVGGQYTFDLSRRKIVQYIDLIRQDPSNTSTATLPYGASWATTFGDQYPWVSAAEFSDDAAGGHGTHTAGSAAGATASQPATTEVCEAGREVSCVGGCIDPDAAFDEDDLIPSFASFYSDVPFPAVDLDRLCPRYDCDGQDEELCLDDDASVNLADHGGIARGAQLSIFDILDDYTGIGISMAGNGIWEPAMEAGSKLHSNSWGGSYYCEYMPSDVLYDGFAYDNPENLLIFAAGNDGDFGDSCTMGSPALAKNILAVGATVAGPGRLTFTGEDGELGDGITFSQDIDTVAYFSSYGPTEDGRIKPEVMAPGDVIYSAAGSGTEDYTCRLWNYPGTSMSCPLVAGSAALIRQYFKDETFYAADVEARGLCESFGCETFSPSAATVKAMLINSANLMGGSSEPNGLRGFGRVHLEPGMPLGGNGDRALFVADATNVTTGGQELTEYSFDVRGGVELRATITWMDPPTAALSAIQLVHDLDLAVYSPSGKRYSMWKSGAVDILNNNERVIVPEKDIEADPGTWTVRVWAKRLSASSLQNYSLVVTGAIGPVDGDGTLSSSSSAGLNEGEEESSGAALLVPQTFSTYGRRGLAAAAMMVAPRLIAMLL